jgi:hypothetical protein
VAARSTFVLSILAVLITALGISRLVFDEPPSSSFDRDAALALSECFSKVDIQINTPVSVAPIPRPAIEKDGKVVELDEKPSSATELTVVATGALTLDIPANALPGAGEFFSLAGKEIPLKKAHGDFELRLTEPALVKRNGADFLVRNAQAVRFGPVEGAAYVVHSDAKVKVSSDGKKAVVEPGTTFGTLPLGRDGQAVTTLQPLAVSHWVADPIPTLMPIRVSGQPGLADVAVEVNESGMSFGAQGMSVKACALRDAAGTNNRWVRAGVSQTQPGALGSAKVMLALPAGVLPAAKELFAPVRIAVASSDGRYLALGGFNAIGRFYAALIATVVTLLLLGLLMYARGQGLKRAPDESPRWFSGLFIGPDNDPSLSLLQVFIWTVITVWGFIYVFIVAGNLMTLTTEMMGLLGIAGTGTVLARWIAVADGGSTSQVAATSTAPAAQGSALPEQTDFWQMLSTNGRFDLLKLQLFVFTVVIAMYVVWRIADAGAFPVLDANTLLLLGVSQGVYVTGKWATTSALSKTQTIKLDLDARISTKQVLEREKVKLEEQQSALAAQVAAAGAAVPDALGASVEANKAALKNNATALKVTDEEIAKLQIDYRRALANLGLKAE